MKLLALFLICTKVEAQRRRLSFFDPSTEEKKYGVNNNAAAGMRGAPPRMGNLSSKLSLPYPSNNMNLIPPGLTNLADLSSQYTRENKEIPFYWHVSKSGGSTIKHMYSDCYGLVEATENGITEGHDNDKSLEIVKLETLNNWKFVNVDTTLPAGIERAAALGTAQSGLVDLLVSPLPYVVAPTLFDAEHKGRIFTIFRDPIERVVSIFYYLQGATHEPTYNPDLAKMTLEEYAFSDLAESNFVSRSLLDKMTAPFVEEDFLTLREIIKTKFIVGLMTDLQESVRRFDSYFGFRDPEKNKKEEINVDCIGAYLRKGVNSNTHEFPTPDSRAYQELARKNHMDIRLHEYVTKFFHEDQAQMFADRSQASA